MRFFLEESEKHENIIILYTVQEFLISFERNQLLKLHHLLKLFSTIHLTLTSLFGSKGRAKAYSVEINFSFSLLHSSKTFFNWLQAERLQNAKKVQTQTRHYFELFSTMMRKGN